MKKVAFFTMDAEVLSDTSCLKKYDFCGECDVVGGLENYAELLAKYNISATYFLTANAIKEWKNKLKELSDGGNELAVHALEHESVLGYDREKFIASIKGAVSLIKENFGVEAVGYRAPCFGVNDDIVGWLKELGVKYDSSALNYKNAPSSKKLSLNNFKQINSITFEKGGFYEFKPPVSNSLIGEIPICGGAYMRLTPWFIMKGAIKKFVEKSDAFLFYVHPFELYEGEIGLPEKMTVGERMYINRGRKSYADKIEKLIKLLIDAGYEFSTIGDNLKHVDKT